LVAKTDPNKNWLRLSDDLRTYSPADEIGRQVVPLRELPADE